MIKQRATDRTPGFGGDARQPDVFGWAGQGGDGFRIAPAMARLTAELGRTPGLVGSLSPEMFR